MKRLITLAEAIRLNLISDLEKVNPKALFSAKQDMVYLSSNTSGTIRRQEVYRENFEFLFIKSDYHGIPCMLTIGNIHNRKANVTLRGQDGFLSSYFAFSKIDSIYSNPNTGIKSRALHREDIEMLKDYKEFKGFEFGTWIYERFYENNIIVEDQYDRIAGIQYVRNLKIYNQLLVRERQGSKFIYSGSFDYCPVIQFVDPNKILVDIYSKEKSGEWRLIPKNGLLKFFYGLF